MRVLFTLAPWLLALPLASGTQGSKVGSSAWRVQRDLVLVDAAGRHYDVAAWCWKVGLRQQATSEMLQALAISDGRYRPAKKALAKMRDFEDKAWERDLLSPKATLLRSFAKRLERARSQDRRGFLELAKWAMKKKLDEEARAVYEGLFLREGEPLVLGDDGRLRLGRSAVREDLSKAIWEAGIDINGRRYLRDEFLKTLPDVGAIFESASEGLRVRSTLGEESAEHLHALGEALLPLLGAELGGRPSSRLELFVFTRRANYDAYLDSAGLSRFRYGNGVADRKTGTAAICADVANVDALALHELTHLFQYGLTRAVMPDWYSEGLAETYGGVGTFGWDGTKLAVGGVLGPEKKALLADPEGLLPLRRLLGADVARVASESGWLFYAQSWAFLRFLRSGAGPQVGERFRHWEAACTGAALGADESDPRASDPGAARALFEATFGHELEALEADFRVYVSLL